jgi:hypothetical protein
MEYVPRQRIAGSDLVALTLRGDSKWQLAIVIKPSGEDKQFEVSFLESLISPSSDKGWRSGGQISKGMFIVVTIFERIWRVNFDQPYLPIGDNKKL